MKYNAYVVKLNDEYLRFGSYNTATPTDNPLNATLYSRLCDAQRRIRKERAWIERQPVMSSQLKVKHITLELVEESEVS